MSVAAFIATIRAACSLAAAASPATGFAKRHEEQQRALVGLALGIDDGGDVLRSNAGRPAKKKPA
mgnify:CR=1 FL=1